MSSSSLTEIKIKDINPNQAKWFVKCQIIRYLPICQLINGKHKPYIKFILMDSEGSKIEALMKEKNYDIVLDHEVDPEKLYIFSNMKLLNNTGQDRMTQHDFILLFTKRTIITMAETGSYSKLGVTPIPIDQVPDLKHTDFLVDVVGVITARSGPKRDLENRNKITKFIFELSDHTGKLECVLHDNYAEGALNFLICSKAPIPIIAIQYAKIKQSPPLLYGNVVIETITNTTMVFFNQNLDDWPSIKIGLSTSGLLDKPNVRYVPLPIHQDKPTSSSDTSKRS